MATKTKTAPAKSSKPAAKQSKKPVVAPVEQTETKAQAGRRIQAAMTKKLLTVEGIAAATGLSVSRVEEHCAYEIGKARAKKNGKGQVVVISQPKYRQG